MRGFSLLSASAGVLLAFAACNESDGFTPPGPRPQIVTAAGPKDGVVVCNPLETGGSCPLPINVTFRLAKGEFVDKALVRFQGDGSDNGVDRGYLVEHKVGEGESVDVMVTIGASVPPTILRRGALFTYTVRLVTGAGEESPTSTLSISVQ